MIMTVSIYIVQQFTEVQDRCSFPAHPIPTCKLDLSLSEEDWRNCPDAGHCKTALTSGWNKLILVIVNIEWNFPGKLLFFGGINKLFCFDGNKKIVQKWFCWG